MVIDIIFVIVAGYGFYVGFSRGIIRTIFTILAYLFGLMAAFKFAAPATKFLESSFNSNSPMMFVAGFLLSFVVTMVLIRFLARGAEGILKTANINVINQFIGGVFMAGIMVLLYSLLLWFAKVSNLLDEQTKDASFTYTYVQHFPNQVWGVYEYIKPTFKDFWDDSVQFMDRIQEMGIERAESDPNIFDIDDGTDEPTSD
ncbi:MAG: CvpA family protein [Phaeodactylibacter sp.]|nr:CvpA family protein [Phaeodactylibacter sp.]